MMTHSGRRLATTFSTLKIKPIVILLSLFLELTFFFVTHLHAADKIAPESFQYRRTIYAEALATWGLHPPKNLIAVSAATIQTESAWRPTAQSAYAKGLTQFTDGTFADMRKVDPSIMDVWNPQHAIRAMFIYHKRLWNQFPKVPEGVPYPLIVDTPLKLQNNRWAFVTASYNGGLGWTWKDQAICAKKACNPVLWFGNVEMYSDRADWAFRENREYPRRILIKWLPVYRGF